MFFKSGTIKAMSSLSAFFRIFAAVFLLLVATSFANAQGTGSSLIRKEGDVKIAHESNVPVTKDFGLGPTRFQIDAAAGSTQTIQLQLTSHEGEDATFRLSTEDFSGGKTTQDSTQLYGDLNGPFPAKNWLKPSVSTLNLAHGERAFIPVTISIPKDAEPGDHYAEHIDQLFILQVHLFGKHPSQSGVFQK